MEGKKQKRVPLVIFALLSLIGSATGCSLIGVPQWSGSGFIKKEFLEYRSVAVLPFEGDSAGEVSNTFARSFHEKFPQMVIVERKRLLGALREEDLYPGRLDEATRSKIGKAFDVQALIMGSVYYPSILRWLLQVIVVDTETGAVLGRSYVEVNFIGAEGVKDGCDLAVQKLTPR